MGLEVIGQKISSGLSSAKDKIKGAIKDISTESWTTESVLNKTPYNNDNYKFKLYIGGDFKNPITAYLPEQVAFSSSSNWEPFLPSLLDQIPLVGSALGNAQKTIDNSISAFGYQVNTRWAKIKSWKGNEAPTFSFDFQFNAYSSPLQEVVIPILRLLSLTMPSSKDGSALVEAPGPDIMKMFLKGASQGMASLAASGKAKTLGNLGGMNMGNTLQGLVRKGAKKAKSLSTGYEKSSFKKQHDKSIILQIGNFMRLKDIVLQSIHPKFDSMFYGEDGLPISAEASCTFLMLYPPTTTELAEWFTGVDSNRPITKTRWNGLNKSAIRKAVGV